MQLRTDNIRLTYHDIVRMVLEDGDEVSPRGLTTYELLDFSLELTDPKYSLPVSVGRQLNTKIAVIEALQLMGGFLDPAAMLRASNAFRQFMDGGTFHGGYGQRTRGQMLAVIDKLKQDPHTRQGIVTLWDPVHDLFTPGMHDYPCTVALQFLIRKQGLVMMTHMRSNDVWRGLPYDLFVFTQLQQAVAAHLAVPVGSYFHHVSSLHMYETDAEAAKQMLDDDTLLPAVPPHGSLFTPGVDWETVQRVTERIAARESLDNPEDTYWLDRGMLQWYKERS